jgi:hypothetical protein
MVRVVYCSVPSMPVAEAILDIVRASEAANASSGVSGLLLHGARRYLQVLEGNDAAVERTMARIRADMRHVLLWEARTPPVARAVSPALPMGYLSDAEIADACRDDLRRLLDAPPRHAAAEAAAALVDLGRRKYPSAILVRQEA